MTTEKLDYIAQRDYLIYLSEKLEARRELLYNLELEMPDGLSLHCESLEHALDTVNARKASLPKEYFDVFPTWETLYFPKCDPVLVAELKALHKQGNAIEYLVWTYNLTLEAVIEHLYSDTPNVS
jgi:hypothetical protein